MPKRKRGDFGDAGAAAHDGESREQRETQKKLQGVFDNGIARLLKALRVARGFEGQKLGKRRKLATDEKEKARLEAETAALEVRGSCTSFRRISPQAWTDRLTDSLALKGAAFERCCTISPLQDACQGQVDSYVAQLPKRCAGGGNKAESILRD